MMVFSTRAAEGDRRVGIRLVQLADAVEAVQGRRVVGRTGVFELDPLRRSTVLARAFRVDDDGRWVPEEVL